ncbi:MAG: NYN domain-containing protein [Sedimentisphaerales bacterium]|nr:NYN domain-containing protein [Sedimentisphaerales bacterium]
MFFIDGHNLLHSVQKDDPDSGPIGDVRLCHIIGSYLKLTGQSGEIIFDGIGPPDKSGFEDISNLEVFFAGLGTDTDTVIEDKISLNTAPRRLRVVSSDRRLRKAARARKATSIKSEVFWNNMQKQLSRRKAAKEPTAKRRGLSESETRQWLDIFGIEQ